jgi:hypothetical protein
VFIPPSPPGGVYGASGFDAARYEFSVAQIFDSMWLNPKIFENKRVSEAFRSENWETPVLAGVYLISMLSISVWVGIRSWVMWF